MIGRDDRHPPPAVAGREDLAAPARDRGEQTRTEITRGVDGVAGVEAERRADQRRRAGRRATRARPAGARDVRWIGDRRRCRHQQRGADDLIDEAAGEGRQKRLRIRREDASRAERACYLAHAAVEMRQAPRDR